MSLNEPVGLPGQKSAPTAAENIFQQHIFTLQSFIVMVASSSFTCCKCSGQSGASCSSLLLVCWHIFSYLYHSGRNVMVRNQRHLVHSHSIRALQSLRNSWEMVHASNQVRVAIFAIQFSELYLRFAHDNRSRMFPFPDHRITHRLCGGHVSLLWLVVGLPFCPDQHSELTKLKIKL